MTIQTATTASTSVATWNWTYSESLVFAVGIRSQYRVRAMHYPTRDLADAAFNAAVEKYGSFAWETITLFEALVQDGSPDIVQVLEDAVEESNYVPLRKHVTELDLQEMRLH